MGGCVSVPARADGVVFSASRPHPHTNPSRGSTVKHKVFGFALAALMAGVSLPVGASAVQAQGAQGIAASTVAAIMSPAANQGVGKHRWCVDASKRENVQVTWHGTNKVTVSTKDHRKACAETRVIFGVYVMPDLWDGQGFNETAFPQQVFKTTSSVVLSEDDITLELPTAIPCKNAQFDVYYAPHLTRLMWPKAHGAQYISSRFQHFG